MTRIDRALLIAAAAGGWGLAGAQFVFHGEALASQDQDFKNAVTQIIERCSVDGEVYVDNPPRGEIRYARIRCGYFSQR